jgi:hypothetical protein
MCHGGTEAAEKAVREAEKDLVVVSRSREDVPTGKEASSAGLVAVTDVDYAPKTVERFLCALRVSVARGFTKVT